MAVLDYELVVNQPGLEDGSTQTIERKFLDLLDQTPAGAQVHMNIYGLKLPEIAEELVKAHKRGVKFDIVMRPFKEPESFKSVEILRTQFKVSELKICGFFCSSIAFNHNKFMLISELKNGTKNIAIHTSNNFWDDERRNFNDFLIIKNNQALYESLKKYFLTIKSGKSNPKISPQITDKIQMYTFPMRKTRRVGKPSTPLRRTITTHYDPALALLKQIKCAPGAKVQFAHSRFTNARKEVAKELKKLKQAGCHVHVMLKNDVSTEKIGPIKIIADSPGSKIKKLLGDSLTVFPYEEGVNGRPYRKGDSKKNAIHSKIILIDAPLGENPEFQKRVLVGTFNFDAPSLKLNNELMLIIDDENLYADYLEIYNSLYQSYLDKYGNK
tara:strand:- start:12437 stop:13588 length:1152 start_codon:yes stop_codon:yes gene_type:complete